MKSLSIVLFLFVSVAGFSKNLILNEVLASNHGSDTLPGGSTPDWVEVLNVDDQAINLKGYSLTNKAVEKYIFPDTIIAPGAIIVVYAINVNTSGLLTCPFSINASEDVISFFDSNSAQLDKIIVSNMPGDVSIGRKNGNTSVDYWFGTPTLGMPNNEQAYTTEAIDEPAFSLPAGKYNTSIKIALRSKDPSATIYYTLNGAVPTKLNGIKYTDSISINYSTPVRAVAIKESCWPSRVATNTYLILKREITLPIVTMTADPSDLFDKTTGMYMMGPNADSKEPYFGANFWQDWERPVHIEIFESDGRKIVDVDAGAQIAGDRSRVNNQKSFSIHCRERYGVEKIKYRLFEDKPIDEIKNITLRNSGGDFGKTQMRDGFISTLVADLDFDRMAYRPAILFINGTYWGIQNIREKISEHYLAENHGIDPDSVDLLEKHNKIKEGSNKDYIDLILFMVSNPVADQANYEYVSSKIEIQNFIDYINTELYIVNVDWPGNNIRYWKTPGRKWRWILYDTDLGYDNCFTYCVYGTTDAVSQKMLAYATQTGNTDWPNPDWSTYMLRNLLRNETFKYRFVNSMADRLNTTFLEANAIKIIDSLQAYIRTEIYYHSVRWDLNYDQWATSIQTMKDFARERPQYVWSDYVDFFGFKGLFNLKLTISDNNAGTIALNSIKVSDFPWSGQYFQNVPITLEAIPKPGYRFVRWEGANTSTSASITIDTDMLCELKAIFELDANSRTDIVINEIMYNDAAVLNSSDWVELVNNGENPTNISGWELKNEKPFASFIIPQGTIISPGQYIVISKDSSAFQQTYDKTAIGNFGFDLSEDRDIVRINDKNGNVIDEVRYYDHNPWSPKADGTGFSLELQAGADSKQASSWSACTFGGTPKSKNGTAPVAGPNTIVITEINYNDSQVEKTGDWFEIYNNGDEVVDLSDWLIHDKSGNSMVVAKGITLQPKQYLVFANDLFNFQIFYPEVKTIVASPLKLGSDEETIMLWDNTGAIVDSVNYTSYSPWPVLANGTGYTLVLKDAALDNSLPINWSIGTRMGTPGEADSAILASKYDVAGVPEIIIYPNPVYEKLMFQAPLGTFAELRNVLGQILLQGTVTDAEFIEFDLIRFNAGTYRISYSNSKTSGSFLIIKY